MWIAFRIGNNEEDHQLLPTLFFSLCVKRLYLMNTFFSPHCLLCILRGCVPKNLSEECLWFDSTYP